jgi:hypothetical protein
MLPGIQLSAQNVKFFCIDFLVSFTKLLNNPSRLSSDIQEQSIWSLRLPQAMQRRLQYPSPLCRLTWAGTHVIGLHVELTILGECDVASRTILGMLMSNIVLTVDTRAH